MKLLREKNSQQDIPSSESLSSLELYLQILLKNLQTVGQESEAAVLQKLLEKLEEVFLNSELSHLFLKAFEAVGQTAEKGLVPVPSVAEVENREGTISQNTIKFDLKDPKLIIGTQIHRNFTPQELRFLRYLLINHQGKKYSSTTLTNSGVITDVRSFMIGNDLSSYKDALRHLKNKLERLSISEITIELDDLDFLIETSLRQLIEVKCVEAEKGKSALFIEDIEIKVTPIQFWMMKKLIEYSQPDPNEWISTKELLSAAQADGVAVKIRGAFKTLVRYLRKDPYKSFAGVTGIPLERIIETWHEKTPELGEIDYYRINPVLQIRVVE